MQAVGCYTTQEWITLREQYDNRCLRCGRHQSELNRVLEQDHVIPLSKGGTNWITNIQPLCHDCNGMGGKGTNTTDYRSGVQSVTMT
jgi:5-methylcytosine-specific restriction endonuclease McrA